MCKIWACQLLPKALKSCPKSNKSPNLVTVPTADIIGGIGSVDAVTSSAKFCRKMRFFTLVGRRINL